MKKQIIITLIIIVFLFLVLSGCSEEKPLKTVKNYALTLNDLPEGYGIYNELFDDKGGNLTDDILFEESYKAYYWHSLSPGPNTTEMLYPAINLYVVKFIDNNEARKFHYENFKTNQSDYGAMDITPKDVKPIGDESNYKLYHAEKAFETTGNVTLSQLGFRVKNIYVALIIMGTPDLEIDYYSFTYNLAEIVNNKIQEDNK